MLEITVRNPARVGLTSGLRYEAQIGHSGSSSCASVKGRLTQSYRNAASRQGGGHDKDARNKSRAKGSQTVCARHVPP